MQLVEPRPSRPIPIRITPLIDVVFILLVFFMLTSRLLPVDFLELGNNTGDTSPVTGEPIPEVTVIQGGTATWDGQTLSIGELIPQLRRRGIGEINLTTEDDTPLGDFTQAFSLLTEADITTHWKRASTTKSQP